MQSDVKWSRIPGKDLEWVLKCLGKSWGNLIFIQTPVATLRLLLTNGAATFVMDDSASHHAEPVNKNTTFPSPLTRLTEVTYPRCTEKDTISYVVLLPKIFNLHGS